jgi:hypothetical protein
VPSWSRSSSSPTGNSFSPFRRSSQSSRAGRRGRSSSSSTTASGASSSRRKRRRRNDLPHIQGFPASGCPGNHRQGGSTLGATIQTSSEHNPQQLVRIDMLLISVVTARTPENIHPVASEASYCYRVRQVLPLLTSAPVGSSST